MKLWQAVEVLCELRGFQPLLASWESREAPEQKRLQKYLDELAAAAHGFGLPSQGLFLHMDIDVQRAERLLHHHDLENYLTPVVHRLGAKRFKLVSGRKSVGGGSRLTIGTVESAPDLRAAEGWEHFSCNAGSGVQDKEWKARLRVALSSAGLRPLPPGPVEVHMAWRCSLNRNWVWLWKPTGDAMGPVLGEPDPRHPFNPSDDRIVSLELHLNPDPAIGHAVEVGMWWRSVAT